MVAMLLGQEVDNTSVVVESYLPSKHDTISPQKKQQTMDVHKFVSKHSLSGLCTCSIWVIKITINYKSKVGGEQLKLLHEIKKL